MLLCYYAKVALALIQGPGTVGAGKVCPFVVRCARVAYRYKHLSARATLWHQARVHTG